MVSLEDIRNTYRFYAPVYDRLFGTVLEPGRRALSAKVNAVQPASILEIGVGTGLILGRYPSISSIVGIDISLEMLDQARHRARHLPLHDIQLQSMNAEALEFEDNSFDCVTLPYVLSVTPNPARLVAEARRVCRRGGTIVILNHFSGSRFWWCLERMVQPLANRIGFRSDFGYTEQVLAYDWHVEAVQPVNLFGLSKLVTIRNV